MSNITSVKCLKCGGFYPPEFLMSGRHVCGSDVPRSRVPDDYGTRERVYSGSVADTAPGIMWQDFTQPIRAPTFAADVGVPFAQAVVSAMLVWILCTVAAYITLRWLSDEQPPFAVAAGIGGFVALIVLVAAWFRGLTYSRETQFNRERRESAPPPPIPEPVKADPERVAVTLEIMRENGADYMQLPFTKEKLRTMARALKSGRSFSVGGLTGAGAPLTRGELESMRFEFMERGYMVWRDEQNRTLGIEFTDAGKALLDELAALP